MGKIQPSYQQRLFNDEELPLPLHDRIVRWFELRLRNDPSAILNAVGFPHEKGPSGDCFGWYSETIEDRDGYKVEPKGKGPCTFLAKQVAGIKPTAPMIQISASAWEHPVKTERGSVIGFVDLAAIIEARHLTLDVSKNLIGIDQAIRSEILQEIAELGGVEFAYDGTSLWMDGKWTDRKLVHFQLPTSYLGIYGDESNVFALTFAKWRERSFGASSLRLLVEAKTKIRSVGELMRQINLYRTHVHKDCQFIVVAPPDQIDPDTRQILEEQRVGVLTYMSN